MSSDTQTEKPKPKETEAENSGRTPSIVKLRRLLGPSPKPRMLTPTEIELLRKSTREVVEVVAQVLAGKPVDGDLHRGRDTKRGCPAE